MKLTVILCLLIPFLTSGQIRDSLDAALPRDLSDAHARLLQLLPDSVLQQMRTGTEDHMLSYHFGLGMWMRNNWGLWSRRSALYWYFDSLGLDNPDNISGVILRTFWCKLNNRSLEIERHIAISTNSQDLLDHGFPFRNLPCPIDSSSLRLREAIIRSESPYIVQFLVACTKHQHRWVFEKNRSLYMPSNQLLKDFRKMNLRLWHHMPSLGGAPVPVPTGEIAH
jgi:hypothetical protein